MEVVAIHVTSVMVFSVDMVEGYWVVAIWVDVVVAVALDRPSYRPAQVPVVLWPLMDPMELVVRTDQAHPMDQVFLMAPKQAVQLTQVVRRLAVVQVPRQHPK